MNHDQKRESARPKVGAAVTVWDLKHNTALRRFLVDADRDVELQDFLDPTVLRTDWADRATEAARLLDGHNGRVGLHGPFFDFQLDVGDPDFRDIAQRRMLTALEAVATFARPKAHPHMVLHSPFSHWDGYNLDTNSYARETKINRVHDCLKPVVARARDLGVALVIENIEDRDPADRNALADSIDGDTVQLSVDTGHAYYAHLTGGAPTVDRFIRAAGSRLAHIHLQDGDGWADRHWQIGEGTLCWPEIFRAIADTGTHPRLLLEMRDCNAVLPSARYLQELGLVD